MTRRKAPDRSRKSTDPGERYCIQCRQPKPREGGKMHPVGRNREEWKCQQCTESKHEDVDRH